MHFKTLLMGCFRVILLGMTQGKRLLALLGLAFLIEFPVGAAEREPKIQLAVDRVVAFLKTQQNKEGAWIFSGDEEGKSNVGATALAALAFLECDVSEDDPAVQRAAGYIRRYVPTLDQTYSLSTAIWFFDRLGEERDVALIQSMGVRVMAGQNEAGGWNYSCPTGGKIDFMAVPKMKRLLEPWRDPDLIRINRNRGNGTRLLRVGLPRETHPPGNWTEA